MYTNTRLVPALVVILGLLATSSARAQVFDTDGDGVPD